MSFCFRLSLVAAMVGGLALASARAESPVSLQSRRAADSLDRVTAVLEVGGNLKSQRDGRVEPTKMNVKAETVYDERTLADEDGEEKTPNRLRSVRYYDRATAQIELVDEKLSPELRADRRLVAVEVEGSQNTLFSPSGPLTRDELDLIDLPAGSLLLDRFLPDRPVAQGDQWAHADDLMMATFHLDRIAKNTVKSSLTEVNDDSAVIEMDGQIDGAVDGVTTQIEVKGKYRFDRRSRRIDWFGLLVRENRGISDVAPGFEVAARLRMQIAPLSESRQLTDAALEGMALRPKDDLTQLVYLPKQGDWKLQIDRRWFLRYLSNEERPLATFRFVDEGELIAQCNVAALSRVESGKQATLEQFQNDIKQALGDAFGQFVSASQKASDQNYRVLRVVTRGTVSGLPIEWRHYLVADEHGRQISFAFTVEEPLADQLGGLDQQMVESLRFDSPEVAGKDQSSR